VARFDAILPAGGRISSPFSDVVGTHSKALIELDGSTILARTLKALNDSGLVQRTVVIGTPEVLQHPDTTLASHSLPEGNTGPDNIFRGLDLLMQSDHAPDKVLIVTTDLPFLTGDVIRRYIELVSPTKHISVPLIREAEFNERFPDTSAMFVKLKDGSFTTGCMYVIDVKALQIARPHIESVFENRKSKLGMAKLLGPAFVAKWLMKKLTLVDVEKKIEAMLGVTGAAVQGSPPELAFDIDYLEDYEYAKSQIAKQPIAVPL
jgi:CTP:molybdopterin cytidylyltransferase MocA